MNGSRFAVVDLECAERALNGVDDILSIVHWNDSSIFLVSEVLEDITCLRMSLVRGMGDSVISCIAL